MAIYEFLMNNSSLAGWRSVAGSNTGERNFLSRKTHVTEILGESRRGSSQILYVATLWADKVNKILRCDQ